MNTAAHHLPPNPRDPEHLHEMLDNAGLEVEQSKVNVFRLEFDKGEDIYDFGYEGGWFIQFFRQLSVTPKVRSRFNWSLRACQLLRLLPRPWVTTMETVVVAARKR